MSDPIRDEILRRLQSISELDEETRFGQLIANLVFISEGPWDEHLWDIEDEKLLDGIRKLEADLVAAKESVPSD